MAHPHYDYLVPIKKVKVTSEYGVVKPINPNKCPFDLVRLDEIGCIYLHPDGRIKN